MTWNYTNSTEDSARVLERQISDGFLNDAVTKIFRWILFGVVCQVISLFGVVTNIINILCFIKQGCHDPVNISFIALAISDIGCLTTLTWANICFTPAFMEADLPFECMEFQYLTGGIPFATFTRITSWITAFITLERCLCITMPFKVKDIFTKQRVTAAMVSIFIIFIVSVSPIYAVHRLGMKYFQHRNKTLLGLVYGENGKLAETVSFTINNFVVPGGAFLMIMVCTAVLVVHLGRATLWSKKAMITAQTEKLTIRNQKIAKMVLIISTLFICCFVPVSLIFLAMSLEPEFSFIGKYRNALTVVGGFGVVMESVNSSANIFIYYNMSIKYRVAFQEIYICKCFKRSDMQINE